MKITVINGTNRENNESLKIAKTIVRLGKAEDHEVKVVNLNNFDILFRGNYITFEKANKSQQRDIKNMSDADVLMFVVPTYHSGIPTPLKNFFDTIKSKEAFDGKIIGVISSNDKNHDLGARQAVQVINGILAYSKLHSFVVPIIPVINFGDIDEDRIEAFIKYCSEFMKVENVYEATKNISADTGHRIQI